MTASQLLERIKNLGSVDDKYIKKIQKQIDNPEKKVKLKAVVGYLIKKEQLTKEQAVELLKPPAEGEFDVQQPTENDYDTGVLIAAEPEPVVEPAEVPVVEVEPEVDVEAVPGELVSPVQEVGFDEPPIAGDPMDDFEESYGSGEYETRKQPRAFLGKRDQKNQFQTKWLYIGFGILGVLLIGVFLLSLLNYNRTPDEMVQAATDSQNRQAWADAVAKWDAFIEAYPSDEQIPLAKARRVQAVLRGLHSSKNYGETITQADLLITKLSEEDNAKVGEIRDDVGLILVDSLRKITDSAIESLIKTDQSDVQAMEAELGEIEGYSAVIDNPLVVSAGIKKSQRVADDLSVIDNNKRTIAGQIEKEKLYNSALDEIAQLRDQGNTDQAFTVYRSLTRKYGDLAARTPLKKLILTITEKEKELVSAIQLDLQPSTESRPSKVDATVVLSMTNGEQMIALKDEILTFLVDGAVYGVDVGTGEIVWRHYVGFQSDVGPQKLDADRTLISDRLHQDLLCVSTQTGEVQWRQAIGESFHQPAISDSAIVLSTESGKVIQLEPVDGSLVSASQLPKATGASALIGQRDPYLYQVGNDSNLYCLSTQSFQCEEVYWLGHAPGAISVPPYQWTGFILVAINGGSFCDLHVLKPEANGLGLKRVQFIPRVVDALVTTPFIKAGRSLIVMGDNGQVQMLDIDPTNDSAPIQPVVKMNFGEAATSRPYLAADGSHLWQAGEGLQHARIRRNQGTIDLDNVTEARDKFVAQIHAIDDHVLHVRRRADSAMISVSLSDGMTLKPIWRTDFAGPLAGPPIRQGESLVAISNQGDVFKIEEPTQRQQFVDAPNRASEVIQTLQFTHVVDVGGGNLAATGPAGRSDLLYVEQGEPTLLVLSPPANKPTSGPKVVGNDLLLPSSTGHVARIAPKSGALRGAPFQPPISPDSKFDWLQPIRVAENRFAIASGQSDADPSKLFLLSTANDRRVEEIASMESPQSFKNQLASDGTVIYAALDAGQTDKLARFNAQAPLAQQIAVDLPANCEAGPWLTDVGVLVKLANNKLHCFDQDLQEKWSIDVGSMAFACPPELAGSQLIVCFQDGNLKLIDPATGDVSAEVDLQRPVIHRPLREGRKMYFSGMDGTLHVVDLQRLAQ